MARFKTLNIRPTFKNQPEPQRPNLRPYSKLRQHLTHVFHRQFLKGKSSFGLELTVHEFKPLSVHVSVVSDTAAYVQLGRMAPKASPEAKPVLHGACLLLTGLGEADEVVLNKARKVGKGEKVPLFPDHALDAAEGGPRPLMVRVTRTPADERDPLVHLTCLALADAFFDQLGQSDPDLPPSPPGGRGT